VEVSGQVHVPVALYPAPVGWEARASPDSLENSKVFVIAATRTMIPQLSIRSLVLNPTTLYRLLVGRWGVQTENIDADWTSQQQCVTEK
jgi:hypothetical protein